MPIAHQRSYLLEPPTSRPFSRPWASLRVQASGRVSQELALLEVRMVEAAAVSIHRVQEVRTSKGKLQAPSKPYTLTTKIQAARSCNQDVPY